MKKERAPAAITADPVAENLLEGRIIKGVGGFYEVWMPESGVQLTCKARGVFRRTGNAPLAGDRVLVKQDIREPGLGVLEEMLPRHSEFVRPPVANMDCMAIVMSAVTPEPDLPLIDKLLLACELRDIRPLLVVNKLDLVVPQKSESRDPQNASRVCGVDLVAPQKSESWDPQNASRVCGVDLLSSGEGPWKRLRDLYAATGYEILAVSCVTGAGMPELLAALAGRTSVLAGQSGVGKSTLLNALLDSERMETGALSEKIGRGRHTTRHAELLPLPGKGWLCDTAGFSRYELDPIPYDTLDTLYPEFEPERQQCRFQGCSHLHEPDCAIQQKLASGFISRERFERYAQFYEELRERHQNRFRRQGGA